MDSTNQQWKHRPDGKAPIATARKLRRTMPPMEAKLWLRLRKLRPQGLHFRRQVSIDAFIVDFACLKHRLVVELDGSQHGEGTHPQHDRARDLHLDQLDHKVLRFWNSHAREDIDSVMDTIIAHCNIR